MDQIEEWRPMVGFEGHYEISNLGNSRRKGKAKNLSPGMSNGYRQIVTCVNGVKKKVSPHRAVLLAFVGPPTSEKAQSNHKDGDKINNRLENLEWVTPSENKIHSQVVLGRGIGVLCHTAKLTEGDVVKIRGMSGKYKDIGTRFGVSDSTVWNIKNRNSWKHVP